MLSAREVVPQDFQIFGASSKNQSIFPVQGLLVASMYYRYKFYSFLVVSDAHR